jgi:N-sulfoglucosamine sulfohydrolase
VRSSLISHADITPSLLDAAGGYDLDKQSPKTLAHVPTIKHGENPGKKVSNYHGRSWLSVIENENLSGWDEIGSSHTFHEITMYYPMRAIRDH